MDQDFVKVFSTIMTGIILVAIFGYYCIPELTGKVTVVGKEYDDGVYTLILSNGKTDDVPYATYISYEVGDIHHTMIQILLSVITLVGTAILLFKLTAILGWWD